MLCRHVERRLIVFAIGDYVMKISNGICRIDDITHLEMSGIDKDKLYYVLSPIEGNRSKLFVCVDTADNNIRSAMTVDEAKNVIESIPSIEEAGIVNEKLREQQYKEAVRSGRPEALVGIIKTIYARKKLRENQGKKNTAIDERYFKQAEDLLYAEIAFVLGKKKDEICDLIISSVGSRA